MSFSLSEPAFSFQLATIRLSGISSVTVMLSCFLPAYVNFPLPAAAVAASPLNLTPFMFAEMSFPAVSFTVMLTVCDDSFSVTTVIFVSADMPDTVYVLPV